jgi:hypothetical protein
MTTLICKSPTVCYLTLSFYIPFYSSVEEKEVLVTAYHEILKLIPKLKNILTYQPNADPDYLNNVIDAVCSALNIYILRANDVSHILYRCRRGPMQPAPKLSGALKTILSDTYEQAELR